MKRLELMVVTLLGAMVLLFSLALMPAVTTAPTSVAEADDGGGMPIGTEVVLSNNTVATYLGETPEGNHTWRATIGAPRYLDDLKTPINCHWEYNADSGGSESPWGIHAVAFCCLRYTHQ